MRLATIERAASLPNGMSDNPWYSFYIGDYDRKTSHLSLLEHGAYLKLMNHYYAMRKPLPDDLKILYRICRAFSHTERKAVQEILSKYFIKRDAQYVQDRCDREIDKLLKYSESQSAAAKRRHMPRLSHGYAKPQPEKKEVSINPLNPQIPIDDWNAYLEMRKKIKKPMTENAKALAISKLLELRAEGHSPASVLQNAVFNSYQGLYPPKPKGNENDKRNSKVDNEFNRIGRNLAAEAERERQNQNPEITQDPLPDAKAIRDD